MDFKQVISLAFQVSVGFTVFALGMQTHRDNLLYLVRRPRLLMLSFLTMFVVIPALALALAMAFDFRLAAEVAIVAIALSPVPPGLPKTEVEAGGSASYAVGLMVTVAALSIVATPVLVEFIADLMGRDYAVSPRDVLTVVLSAVALPLAAGMGVAKVFPRLRDRIGTSTLARIANVLLLLALLLLLIGSLGALWSASSLGTLLAMVVFNALAIGIGHAMGGPERENAIVLGYSSANRHPGIAIAIAAANYPTQSFGGTVILYFVINSIVSKQYLRLLKRPAASGVVGDSVAADSP